MLIICQVNTELVSPDDMKKLGMDLAAMGALTPLQSSANILRFVDNAKIDLWRKVYHD